MGIHEKIRAANEQENREESAKELADAIETLIAEKIEYAINKLSDAGPRHARQRLAQVIAKFSEDQLRRTS